MEHKQLKLPMFRIEKIESNEDRQFFNFGSEINKKLDNLIIELKNHKDFKDLNLPLEFLFDCMIGYSIFNNMNTGKSLRDTKKLIRRNIINLESQLTSSELKNSNTLNNTNQIN